MRKFLSVILPVAMALAGCSFGKPYIAPAATEPSAEIVVKAGDYFELINMDEKGCYSGFVSLHPATGVAGQPAGIRVHADRRLVMHHERSLKTGMFSSKICRMEFSFTPRKDAKYTATTGVRHEINEKASHLVKALGADEVDMCTVEMMEEGADGAQARVALTTTRPMPKSFNCIRFQDLPS